MSTGAVTSESTLWTAFILGAILPAAFALRVFGMADEAPWNDEVLSLRYIEAPSWSVYSDLVFSGDPAVRHVPFYFFVQYWWAQFFGASVYSLRLLSVTSSLSSLIVLFFVARRLYGARAGYCAAAVYAVSLPHIYFGQEIRMYALVTFLVLVSVYCFLRAVAGDRPLWWAALFFVDTLLLFTHVLGPLIWIVQGTFLAVFRRTWRGELTFWFATHAALSAIYLWWLARLEYTIYEEYVHQTTPTYRELLNAFNVYAGGRFGKLNPALYLPTGFSLDRILTVTFGLCAIFVGIRTWQALKQRVDVAPDFNSSRAIEAYAFALGWLLVPPLLLFIESQFWKPLLLFRYALYSSLGLYVLVGAGISWMASRRAQLAMIVFIAAVFAHQLLALTIQFRPDYPAADAYIREHDAGEDTVLVFKEHNGLPFQYNSSFPAPRIETHQGLGELLTAAVRATRQGQAWVVLWQWDDFDGFESHLADRNIDFEQQRFGGVPALYLYRIWRSAAPLRPEGSPQSIAGDPRDFPEQLTTFVPLG